MSSLYFHIYRYFKKFGELGDIYIPRDRHTHESRGFAFVRFYEERDAEDAMDAMDGKVSWQTLVLIQHLMSTKR